MYKSGNDNHQANMTIVVTESNMELADKQVEVVFNTGGYVSHSFNQFIQTDGTYVYRVDHGDAYPRAVSVTRCSVEGSITNNAFLEVLSIPGLHGANETGVSVGGFEIGADNLLIAGNSVDVSDKNTYNALGQRNIFVSVVDRAPQSRNTVWFTNYTTGSTITPRTPQLVKVNDNRFLLMWEEYNSADKTVRVRMCLIDDTGTRLSNIITADMRLSDCKPIVTADGQVTWYVSDGVITLYKVDPFDLSSASVSEPEGLIAYGSCGPRRADHRRHRRDD